MKFKMIFLLWIIPFAIYALPCPNGNGFLYKGNSMEDVIQQCGEPTKKKVEMKYGYILEELIYLPHHLHDPGSAKLIVILQDGVVTSIRVDDQLWLPECLQYSSRLGKMTIKSGCGESVYMTGFTSLCHDGVFRVGETEKEVRNACGKPESKTILKNTRIAVTTFYYGGTKPQAIIFYDGKLHDWQ